MKTSGTALCRWKFSDYAVGAGTARLSAYSTKLGAEVRLGEYAIVGGTAGISAYPIKLGADDKYIGLS
jgi:hypothetical protein